MSSRDARKRGFRAQLEWKDRQGGARIGPVGQAQVEDVVALLAKGVQFVDACRSVAADRGITVETVRDACTTRFGLARDEFVALHARGGVLRRLERIRKTGSA